MRYRDGGSKRKPYAQVPLPCMEVKPRNAPNLWTLRAPGEKPSVAVDSTSSSHDITSSRGTPDNGKIVDAEEFKRKKEEDTSYRVLGEGLAKGDGDKLRFSISHEFKKGEVVVVPRSNEKLTYAIVSLKDNKKKTVKVFLDQSEKSFKVLPCVLTGKLDDRHSGTNKESDKDVRYLGKRIMLGIEDIYSHLKKEDLRNYERVQCQFVMVYQARKLWEACNTLQKNAEKKLAKIEKEYSKCKKELEKAQERLAAKANEDESEEKKKDLYIQQLRLQIRELRGENQSLQSSHAELRVRNIRLEKRLKQQASEVKKAKERNSKRTGKRSRKEYIDVTADAKDIDGSSSRRGDGRGKKENDDSSSSKRRRSLRIHDRQNSESSEPSDPRLARYRQKERP